MTSSAGRRLRAAGCPPHPAFGHLLPPLARMEKDARAEAARMGEGRSGGGQASRLQTVGRPRPTANARWVEQVGNAPKAPL